jgi:replication factor A1
MKMEKQELAPHVSEIARVLGNKIDEKDIEKELDTYLNLYRVSLETAKRSVVRKLGGDPNALTMGVRKLIAELSGTEMSVDLLVKVLTVNHKDIEQNGETKQILYGLMADEGGSIAYTAWDAERFQLERGKVYLIRNAYTKEWNSQPQLNLSTRATIEPQPDDSMKLPEGMDVPSYGPTNATVVELKEGMNSVTITAKVISSEGRKLETPNADATGKVQFSAWHDFGLKSGDTIIIRGAYVRTWRGIPQLNFSERAGVERTKTSFGSDQELSRPRPRSIGELESIGGAVDVLVRGVVVDIKKGSGLIFRCPQCKRLVQKGLCRIHGKVDGQPDLRIKAVVDDGMAALTAVLNKDITEMLVGITLAESLREAKEAMNPEVVEEKVKDRMLGKPIEVRGNVTSDEYGLMMIVTEAELKVPEVRSEAASLLSELEGAQ